MEREVWRPNSNKVQPSNGYCCSKGRYIKYKPETGASIYGPDNRCINQVCGLAQAVAAARSLGSQRLRLLYGLHQIHSDSLTHQQRSGFSEVF